MGDFPAGFPAEPENGTRALGLATPKKKTRNAEKPTKRLQQVVASSATVILHM